MISAIGQIGLPEILIIIAAIVLIFGATQIPKIARSLGEGLKEFKKAAKEAKKMDEEEETSESNEAKKKKSSKKK